MYIGYSDKTSIILMSIPCIYARNTQNVSTLSAKLR